MRLIKSLVLTFVICAVSNLPLNAFAEESVILKVNGIYCQFCVSATMMKLKRAPGVENIIVWLKDGKLNVIPSGGNQLNLQELASILANSSYRLVGSMEFRSNGRIVKEGNSVNFVAHDTGNRYQIANPQAVEGKSMVGYVRGIISPNRVVTVSSFR